jgi:hypothetical protein
MPFNPSTIALFFMDAVFMCLMPCIAGTLSAEGIAAPSDLLEFNKEGLKAIFCNLRKPAKVLRDGAAGARGELCKIKAYELSAKSQMHLFIVVKVATFYEDIRRDLDPGNMSWVVIKRFHEQYKALMERKKSDSSTAPKLTKGIPTHKWLEAVNLNIMQLVGVRRAPLAYCVCALAARAPVVPALKVGEPHSVEHGGSINGDMIACMSHQHALFKVDNATVFDILNAMLYGTTTHASIAQYHCLCNGRSAYIDVCAQHAGKDVWDKPHKDAEDMLQNRKWNGMANVTLSQHMAKH